MRAEVRIPTKRMWLGKLFGAFGSTASSSNERNGRDVSAAASRGNRGPHASPLLLMRRHRQDGQVVRRYGRFWLEGAQNRLGDARRCDLKCPECGEPGAMTNRTRSAAGARMRRRGFGL